VRESGVIPLVLRNVGLAAAGFTFHDRRHTGNIAAAFSASTRELMHRMGHSSMRAALIYQHATSERDREIAAGMDKRIIKQQGKKAGKKKRRDQAAGGGPAPR
jgi:integrase